MRDSPARTLTVSGQFALERLGFWQGAPVFSAALVKQRIESRVETSDTVERGFGCGVVTRSPAKVH